MEGEKNSEEKKNFGERTLKNTTGQENFKEIEKNFQRKKKLQRKKTLEKKNSKERSKLSTPVKRTSKKNDFQTSLFEKKYKEQKML